MTVTEDGPTDPAGDARRSPRYADSAGSCGAIRSTNCRSSSTSCAGSMSLVGPRPHAVAHNEEYRRLIKGYMVRHKVLPGITGLAQVNGCRGETTRLEDMKARIEYDLDYLRHWTPALDLRILFKPLIQVLCDRKAY